MTFFEHKTGGFLVQNPSPLREYFITSKSLQSNVELVFTIGGEARNRFTGKCRFS